MYPRVLKLIEACFRSDLYTPRRFEVAADDDPRLNEHGFRLDQGHALISSSVSGELLVQTAGLEFVQELLRAATIGSPLKRRCCEHALTDDRLLVVIVTDPYSLVMFLAEAPARTASHTDRATGALAVA